MSTSHFDAIPLITRILGRSDRDADALRESKDLRNEGLDSMGMVELIDALETDTGIEIDPAEDIVHLRTVGGIEGLVSTKLGC